MTCGKCVASVKSELLKIGDVVEANVQLPAPQATVTMQKHIPLPVLQSAVSKAGNYLISDDGAQMDGETSQQPVSLKVYWPVILISLFVTGISLITSIEDGSFNLMLWMNYFMGGFFIAFSFFKFLNLEGFADGYSSYDLLAGRVRFYGFIYPFIELALGVAYLTGFEPIVTNITTIILMGFSSLGVIKSLVQKQRLQCACLGTVFNLPMSSVTILENVVMVVMAVLMLVFFH